MTPKLLEETISKYVQENRAHKISSEECSNKVRLLNHIYGVKTNGLSRQNSRTT